MPKTQNAFALKELWLTVKELWLNFRTDEDTFRSSFGFIEYFNELRKATAGVEQNFSRRFYAVENVIGKILKYSLPKTFESYDAAERTREQLRGAESLIKRIGRHGNRLRRLSRFEVKNKSRLEELISRYQDISDVIKSYHLGLQKYQPFILAQVTKEFSKEFGKRLRRARRVKDISQDQISKDMALSQITISGYERGTREPTLYTLFRLVKELGVSADYLLGITDEPPKF